MYHVYQDLHYVPVNFINLDAAFYQIKNVTSNLRSITVNRCIYLIALHNVRFRFDFGMPSSKLCLKIGVTVGMATFHRDILWTQLFTYYT